MDYSELLRHPFWQKRRLEILQRDKFACRECTDKLSNLQIHHLYYIKDALPWEYPDEALITVCDLCHLKLEFYKFLKKYARIYLLFNLKLTIADTEEVIELMKRKVKDDYYRNRVMQYIEDIKNQLRG